MAAGSDKPIGWQLQRLHRLRHVRLERRQRLRQGVRPWAPADQNACPGGLGGPPDRIGVYLKVKHQAFTGLVFNTIEISESSILSLEPIPVANGCKP